MAKYSIKFAFENKNFEVEEQTLENILGFALRSFYGIIGSGLIHYEILQLSVPTREIIIFCEEENISKISTAISLVGSYGVSRLRGKISKIDDHF